MNSKDEMERLHLIEEFVGIVATKAYYEVEKLRLITGLTSSECDKLLQETNGDAEKAFEMIEYFMDSLAGTVVAKKAIEESIKNAGIYNKLAASLSSYNTNRGGHHGFKGFVFEELHAADATVNGRLTEVIANNGRADFRIFNPDGSITEAQAKIGYRTTSVDWSLYEGQTVVIDKGNQELINSARRAGMDVIESNISEKEAKSLAKGMKLETKLTGKEKATIVPKIHSAGKIAEQCHASGIKAAKNGAAFGAGFSIGTNVVDLIDGEKDLKEVASAVTKDTAIAAASSYVVGAATTAIGSTAAGAAITTAATAAGTAIASSAVGGAAIAAGTAVAGAATATGAAIAGTAAAAGTALAGTAVGTAVVGTATAAGTAIAGTAAAAGTAIAGSAVGTAAAAAGTAIAGTAVGGAAIAAGAAVTAAAVAAAPVVLTGAAIGGIVALGRKIFRK